jgi:hypothetical protein
MSKVVRFIPKDKDDIVSALEMLLEKAKNNEFDNFIFACKLPSREVATSWCNADFGLRAELISHNQVDLMAAMVEANYLE